MKSETRIIAEAAFACPSCDAPPGKPCRAKTKWSGIRDRAPHQTRLALVRGVGDPSTTTGDA